MRKDITSLVVRLIIGGIFITAGYLKVSEMAGTIAFFAQLGIPAFLAYIVTYAELIGGAFLVLGLWTCIPAAVLSVVMVVAIYLSFEGGFQAYSYPLVVLAGLISLIGSCGGRYSLTSCKGCKSCATCAAGDSAAPTQTP